jgi:hypothetical protein
MAQTYEYQVVIVHQDGTEELSRWMKTEQQVAQVLAAHPSHCDACWLRERNNAQEIVLECRITDIPSPRCHPHDSGYLLAVGSRNRCELLSEVIGCRH